MTQHKTIRRIILISCRACGGNGYQHNAHGQRVRCEPCRGEGEVEQEINEVVSEGQGVAR